MQGEYLIDAFHNVALQLGPLPSDRSALLERLRRIGFFHFADGEVKVNSAALFAAPAILKKMVSAQMAIVKQIDPDLLCGASPMGTAITTHLCIESQTPMLFRSRPGGELSLQGEYFAGQRVLIIDDLLLSADEIMMTACFIRKERLVVTDAVVLLDAAESGKEQLAQFGIRLHPLITIEEFFPNIPKNN